MLQRVGHYGTLERLQRVATSYGGTNLYGQPNYKLVWGNDRMTRKYTAARYEHGFKVMDAGIHPVHKYSPRMCERYHIEKWCPPDFYGTPETWHRDTVQFIDGREIETLGPYPVRGDYETLWTFQTPDGKYLEPTTDILIIGIKRNQQAISRRVDEEIIERRLDDARQAAAVDSQKRTVMRELTKEFMDKAMPGRTIRQLKEELIAPRG